MITLAHPEARASRPMPAGDAEEHGSLWRDPGATVRIGSCGVGSSSFTRSSRCPGARRGLALAAADRRSAPSAPTRPIEPRRDRARIEQRLRRMAMGWGRRRARSRRRARGRRGGAGAGTGCAKPLLDPTLARRWRRKAAARANEATRDGAFGLIRAPIEQVGVRRWRASDRPVGRARPHPAVSVRSPRTNTHAPAVADRGVDWRWLRGPATPFVCSYSRQGGSARGELYFDGLEPPEVRFIFELLARSRPGTEWH
jgi:hypothetical protein